jgi:outer membrane protein insertion porin family
MVYRAVAISTLAALAAGNLINQALASPNPTTSSAQAAARNYVVPLEASPAPHSPIAIAAPEAIAKPESAQVRQMPVSQSAPQTLAQSTQTPTRSTSTRTVAVPTTSESAQSTKTSVNSTNRSTGSTVNAPTQFTPAPARSTNPNEVAVIATDVQIRGVPEELQQIVSKTISTRVGGSTSQSQLQNDVAAILDTGFFTDARVSTSQNRDGINVVFQVAPVVVRSLQLSGNQVLTPEVANNFFKSQIGQPVSPSILRQGIQQLSQWYKDNNYVLAQVVDVQPNRNGTLTVEVAEGVIGNINIRFLDKEGKPTQGRTKTDFLNREIKLKPGEVFRVDAARQDLQHLYQLGLFDNANISLNGDATKVDLTYDLVERPARGVNVGGGYSADTGLFGTISYKDQNFGGVNQQVGLDAQVGSKDVQFNGNYTIPYRASNPEQPGVSVNAFRRRTVSQTFDDNFNNTVEADNYQEPREGQFGGGVALTKPVGEWDASLGLNYTRTSIRDKDGNIIAKDSLGNPLSLSGTGIDDLVAITTGVSKDQRDNPINPTSGSILSLSSQQSIPVGSGNILMNQIQANYSQYVPVNLFGGKKPDVLAFNVQGGTTIGDLPPYEAFNLGGVNSVRGYGAGEVASGRSYVLASAEYRIPVFDPVGAVLFADFGSDLGSADTVPGEPGVVRGKPGTGFGYGAGVRINSPLGIIRADYGFNDQGDSKLQFGIGQRF